MAIQTIKATIQMRYGMEADLQPDQLVTGEWAVATDIKKVWMCFRPGLVLRMATYEAFEQDMKEIQLILATCQDIQAAVERFKQLAEQHASQAEEWSVTSKSWAIGGTGTREGEDTDNSKYYSEQSKNEANRAKNEADRAAAIAGIDIDSELSETSSNPVQNKVITNVLKKFEDLKTVAFTGKYTDLTDRLTLTNNLLATVAGTALDATMGKALDDKIATLNTNLTNQISEIIGNLGKKYTAESEDVSCISGNSTITSARLVVPAGTYIITASVAWDNGADKISGYRRIFITQGDYYNSDSIIANDVAGCRSAQTQSISGVFVSTSANNVMRIFLLQSNANSANITATNIKLQAIKIK